MKWSKIENCVPGDASDFGEVLIFNGVIQENSYFLIDEGMGLYWGSNHPDIDEPIPAEPGDQWAYIRDVTGPDLLDNNKE